MNSDSDNSDNSGSRRGAFLPLLIALSLMLILIPLSESFPLMYTVLGSLVLLSGMPAVLSDRSFRMTAGAALVICLPLRWAAHFLGHQSPILILLSHVTVLIYFMILAAVVLVRVIAHPQVTRQTVIGAICGYLLIGYIFTSGYSVLTYLEPGSISVGGQPLGVEQADHVEQHLSELSYFSFASLTTVGYGDIVPVTPFARAIAVVEVLVGQLYLAGFVARLVGALGSSVPRQHED